MSQGAEIIVAGAGVLGLTTALALADAGCRVTVFDPAPPDVGASAVAAGMLAPVYEALLDEAAAPHFDLLLAARNLWPELAARTGIFLDRTGAMAVGDADWLETLAVGMSRLGPHGVGLPAGTARGLAPGLSDDFPQALLTREDWRLDAGPALAALRRAAEARGVGFRPEAVTGRGEADLLVLATGAGETGLAPELAVLTPIKGHILRLRTEGIGGTTVRAQSGYAVPVGDGLAVGATMERGVSDPRVDPGRAGELLRLGRTLFPAIGEAPYRLAAGVRAATPDGLPLVGPSAEPGVLLATGARRNGWLLAPLVARLITALATGAEPGPHAARFDPRRFSPG